VDRIPETFVLSAAVPACGGERIRPRSVAAVRAVPAGTKTATGRGETAFFPAGRRENAGIALSAASC